MKKNRSGDGTAGAPLVIRPVGPADAEALTPLVRALALFDGKGDVSHLTPDKVAGWLSGPDPVFDAVIALSAGEALGYAAFYRAFSLYKGSPVMLLENLYVTEAARKRGVGRRLVAAVAAEAQRRGYRRMELHVTLTNHPTRAFYERIGLEAPGEAVYRIEDGALDQLADEEP